MDFSELAKSRYSVRKFDAKPVEEEKLDKILQAGNVAPTAANKQPQRIYVISSAEGLEKIRSLTRCHYGAPVVLLVAYDKTEEWKNPVESGVSSGQQDASIVATHIMLEAWNVGVGSCWVNMFSPTQVAEAFGLPSTEVPVLLMPLGYVAEDCKPAAWHTQNKRLEETVKKI